MKPSWASFGKWMAAVCWHLDFQKDVDFHRGNSEKFYVLTC